MNDLAQRFDALLAPYAVHNAGEHRRAYNEAEHPQKLPFQRDRDRIIHCKAFRRLKHKTQVLVSPKGDHYRDRLTHSLEGAQIARGLCRNLRLNEDLAEAGILAHDLGHPPSGHEGEHALHELLEPLGFSFDHNQHSLRIVTVVENAYPDFPGLNLTEETINCLRKHETPWEFDGANMPHGASLEAQVVNHADEIAYYAHDIDDGLRVGLVQMADLEQLQIAPMVLEVLRERYPNLKRTDHAYYAQFIRSLIHALISDITTTTEANLATHNIKTLNDVYVLPTPVVNYSAEAEAATDELRQYLFSQFYTSPAVRQRTEAGKERIRALFTIYLNDPTQLPESVQARIDKPDPLPIVIKDYIAGMTDNFLKEMLERLL